MAEIMVWWLILTVAVGAIAAARGRSFMGFAFIALVLSPLIGLIVVLLSSSGDALQREPARDPGSRDYRVCPQCAETVRREAKICIHCRYDLTSEPPPPTTAEQVGRTVAGLFK